jgi:hypothetical protein
VDFEQTAITIFVAIVAATAAGFVTWLFKGKERKESVEEKAVEKGIVERGMAKELKENAEKIAASVKEETMAAVDQLFTNLRSEIALEQQKIYSNMNAREVKLDRLEKDFESFKQHIYNAIDRFNKDIQRIQTMAWGSSAKSVPSYLLDEEETQEHKDTPDEGVFYRQTDAEKAEQTSDNEERIKQDEDDGSGY